MGIRGAYRLLFIFEKAHSVLYDDFILESNQLDDFLGYPWPNDLQVDLTHINLIRKALDQTISKKLTTFLHTFLSNSAGNFIDFKSFSSLSENRRSWSALVPLKNPTQPRSC